MGVKCLCCLLCVLLPITFWGKDFSQIVYDRDDLQVINMNLDLEPEHRWDEAYQVFKDKIPSLASYFRRQIKNFLGDDATIESAKITIREGAFMDLLYTPEIYREIQGLAALDREMDEIDVSLFNMGYEFSMPCTSIACSHISDSTSPYMLRNLLDGSSDDLHKMLFIARFTRGGKEVARGITFFGLVGLFAGVAEGRVAAVINYRKSVYGSSWYNYISTFAGSWSPSILLRESLLSAEEGAKDYDGILHNYLMPTHLIAPCYFTVVGTKPGEGSVIIRGRYSEDNYQTSDVESGVIVQTNTDPGVTGVDSKWMASGDPLLKNSIKRREKALGMCRGAIYDGKLPGVKVLEASPISGEHILYHAILSPSQGPSEMCHAWK